MSPFFRGLGGSRNLTPDAPVNLLLVLCEAENGGSRFHSSLAPERQGECHHCVTLYSLSALKKRRTAAAPEERGYLSPGERSQDSYVRLIRPDDSKISPGKALSAVLAREKAVPPSPRGEGGV